MKKFPMMLSIFLLALTCNFPQTLIKDLLQTNSPELHETSTAASTPKPTNTSTPAPTPVPSDLVWFGPNMGSTDFPELFSKPEEWSEARARIDVFKFHQRNVIPGPCQLCGDNYLDAFVNVQAFKNLKDWGIATGIDVGALKEYGCGKVEFRDANFTIQNIESNGGSVSFLVMDEPYLGGEWAPAGSQPCQFSMDQSADATSGFMKRVKTTYAKILVGDTEPYPYFSVTELEQWILALEERGATPAFFHLDVDFWRVRVERQDVAADLKSLSEFFNEHGIPFGVIMTADWNVKSNRTYFDSTMEWIRTVNEAVGKPQQVVFNSWLGPAPSGLHEIPVNLPENEASIFSHTRLIIEGLDVFGP